MKKKKMKLDELKVKSFITEEINENAETVKGGGIVINPSYVDGCRSALIQCQPQSLVQCTTTIVNSKICSWNDGCGSALGCTTTTFDTGGGTVGGGTGY